MNGNAELIRSFIAIGVIESVKSAIIQIQSNLRKLPGANVSWVRPEGVHLTLKFLGAVERERLEKLSEALDKYSSRVQPFEVRVTAQGGFPNMRNPRVLWIGLDGGEVLLQVQKDVELICRKLGFEKDEKRFHPHLTVCRVKSIDRDSKMLSFFGNEVIPEISWMPGELRLMESQLSPQGARYRAISIHKFED